VPEAAASSAAGSSGMQQSLHQQQQQQQQQLQVTEDDQLSSGMLDEVTLVSLCFLTLVLCGGTSILSTVVLPCHLGLLHA